MASVLKHLYGLCVRANILYWVDRLKIQTAIPSKIYGWKIHVFETTELLLYERGNGSSDGNTEYTRRTRCVSEQHTKQVEKKKCFSAKCKCGNSAPTFKYTLAFVYRIMYISFGSYHVISLLCTECVFSVSSVLFAPISYIFHFKLLASTSSSFLLRNFNFEFTTF